MAEGHLVPAMCKLCRKQFEINPDREKPLRHETELAYKSEPSVTHVHFVVWGERLKKIMPKPKPSIVNLTSVEEIKAPEITKHETADEVRARWEAEKKIEETTEEKIEEKQTEEVPDPVIGELLTGIVLYVRPSSGTITVRDDLERQFFAAKRDFVPTSLGAHVCLHFQGIDFPSGPSRVSFRVAEKRIGHLRPVAKEVTIIDALDFEEKDVVCEVISWNGNSGWGERPCGCTFFLKRDDFLGIVLVAPDVR
jgi:hypothetical protein